MKRFRFTTVSAVTIYRDYEITARDEAEARKTAEAIIDGDVDAEPVGYDEDDWDPPTIFNDEIEEITS